MKRFVTEFANYERERLFEKSGAVKKIQAEREREISTVENACKSGLITEHAAVEKIAEIGSRRLPVGGEYETFYTGGGIWISAMHDGKGGYYTVANDFSDEGGYLTYYTDAFEDEVEFPCVEMEWSKDEADLTDAEMAIYKVLQADLKGTLEKWG